MGRPLKLDVEAIRALCERFGVSRLAVFGSATTARFDPQRSDVDFLVQFHRKNHTSYKTVFALKQALQQLLGRDVDIVMNQALENPYFAESFEKSRRELYAA